MSNNKMNKEKILNPKECYICGIDLKTQKIRDRNENPNNPVYQFPTMTLWNGVKKELCGSCYKNHLQGMEIYQENNPNWKAPKSVD